MTKTKSASLTLVALAAAPLAANAVPIEITATSTDWRWGDFTIVYDDTGDGLFSFEELVSFSGVELFGVVWEYLGVVPDVAGVSVFSQHPLNRMQPPGFWGVCMADPCTAGMGLSRKGFEYTVRALSVPEPSTLALLGLGLLGLGVARRRKTS